MCKLSVTVVRMLMSAVKFRSYPAGCAEQSECSEERGSSKQSLLLCGFPAVLHLKWTKHSVIILTGLLTDM